MFNTVKPWPALPDTAPAASAPSTTPPGAFSSTTPSSDAETGPATMTLPAELIIARHGEAHCNREQIVGGSQGCRGLTDRGRRQIERLAQRLGQEHHERPIHAIYTTPLRRAQESAAIIGAYLSMDAVIVADLAEQDYGAADGRPWTDVVAEYGDIPALDADRPLAAGGETWREYLHRATIAIGEITTRHVGERVLLVGHGETIDAAFQHFLAVPIDVRATAAVAAYHASVTAWVQQPLSWTRPSAGWRWTLTSHNDTRHLFADAET
ncbi:histidine phosphatase family protein [Micromonospora craniellae]|uniref:Histidine phosphatase family protein n=2 Tax=Micromonospora craniellae TaxID=2294034 RepID=A0A372FQR4_9ACTN|nr:histidine phosphatase family protein [Micromonospora craniellae]